MQSESFTFEVYITKDKLSTLKVLSKIAKKNIYLALKSSSSVLLVEVDLNYFIYLLGVFFKRVSRSDRYCEEVTIIKSSC